MDDAEVLQQLVNEMREQGKKTMRLNPKHADGLTQDLDGNATTIWYGKHECACGEPALPESSMRVYCYTCGVWWWNDGLDELKDESTGKPLSEE